MNSEERRVAANTVAKNATYFLSLLTGLFLTPFLITNLGKEVLGIQVLANNGLQFLLLLSGAFVAGYGRFATLYFAQGDFKRMNSTLSNGLLLAWGSAGIVLIGSIIAAIFVGPLFAIESTFIPMARILILMVGSLSAFGILLTIWETPTLITQRIYINELAHMGAILVSAGLVIILFYLLKPNILIWVLISGGTGLVFRLFFVIPHAKKLVPQTQIHLKNADYRQGLGLIRFSGWAFWGSIGNLLFYATDAFIITHLGILGPDKVLPYDLGARWSPQIRQIIAGFTQSLVPFLTSLFAANNLNGINSVFLKSVRYCLLVAIFPCLVLTFFARPIIWLWVGEAFVEETAPIMQLTMASLLFSIPAIPAYHTLFALGQIKESVIATCIAGILNIFLSIFLAKYAGLGLVGVALGTVITLTAKNTFLLPWLVCKKTKIKLVCYFQQTWSSPLLCALFLMGISAGLYSKWRPEGILSLLGLFFLLGVLYIVIVWEWGLNRLDRRKTLALLGDSKRILNHYFRRQS